MWNHQGSHFEIVRPQCRYKQQAFMSKLSLCPKIAGFDKQLKQLYNFKFKFLVLPNRVSQKNQKSEFCFATNPTGFHRLDEPPEKFSAL